MSVSLDPDESLAQVEADVRRSDERAARMPAFEAALSRVRGDASSPGRDIHVQVDATGRVVGLRLSETAVSRGSRRLSADILTVIRAAERSAQNAALEAVSDLLGAEDPITEQLRSTGTAG